LPHEHVRTEKKERGCWECRDYHLLGEASFLDMKGEWASLSHVGWVRRECHENGEVSVEDRFYLVSGSPTVKNLGLYQIMGSSDRLMSYAKKPLASQAAVQVN